MHARAVQYSTIYTHLYILNSFTKSEVQNSAYGKNGGSRAQRFCLCPSPLGDGTAVVCAWHWCAASPVHRRGHEQRGHLLYLAKEVAASLSLR